MSLYFSKNSKYNLTRYRYQYVFYFSVFWRYNNAWNIYYIQLELQGLRRFDNERRENPFQSNCYSSNYSPLPFLASFDGQGDNGFYKQTQKCGREIPTPNISYRHVQAPNSDQPVPPEQSSNEQGPKNGKTTHPVIKLGIVFIKYPISFSPQLIQPSISWKKKRRNEIDKCVWEVHHIITIDVYPRQSLNRMPNQNWSS